MVEAPASTGQQEKEEGKRYSGAWLSFQQSEAEAGGELGLNLAEAIQQDLLVSKGEIWCGAHL